MSSIDVLQFACCCVVVCNEKGNELLAFGTFHDLFVQLLNQKLHFEALVIEDRANRCLKVRHQHSCANPFSRDIANADDVFFITQRNEVVIISPHLVTRRIFRRDVHPSIRRQI